MFRKIRRSAQALPYEEAVRILVAGSAGVLAVSGDEGYPYAVPLSYVWHDGKIYIHCAKDGHKIDAIGRNEKVSFCVVAQDKVIPEEYTTYYRSAIAFGRARILPPEEIPAAMVPLADKYWPENSPESRDRSIAQAMARLCMIEITIDHLSGKAAIELVKAHG